MNGKTTAFVTFQNRFEYIRFDLLFKDDLPELFVVPGTALTELCWVVVQKQAAERQFSG
jgi:hypothetical protein